MLITASLSSVRFMILITSVAASVALGCAAPEDDEELGDQSLGFSSANTLIEEDEMEGDQAITSEAVQAVLDSKNSPLANYSVGGRSAAEIIVEESIAQHISPIFMLARIQTEQSLITSRSNIDNIESATGCGCHDARRCASQYKGFDKQIKCTALMFRTYLDNISEGKYALNGNDVRASDYAFLIGRRTRTLDPLRNGTTGCYVTPTNAATAALLTYTPYVGKNVTATCSSMEPGGAGLQIRTLRSARLWFAAVE